MASPVEVVRMLDAPCSNSMCICSAHWGKNFSMTFLGFVLVSDEIRLPNALTAFARVVVTA